MEITPEQIAKAFQLGGAAVGGGFLWKLLDFFAGKRRRNVDTDGAITDSAIKLVQSLNMDIERLKAENKKSDSERTVCLDNYEKLRLDLTDMKIAMRSMYEHMRNHMANCDHPTQVPELPHSLQE